MLLHRLDQSEHCMISSEVLVRSFEANIISSLEVFQMTA